MLDYLRSYAVHFNLLYHIQFRTEVLNVQRAEDFEQNGQWMVTYRKRIMDKEDDDEGEGEQQKVEQDTYGRRGQLGQIRRKWTIAHNWAK